MTRPNPTWFDLVAGGQGSSLYLGHGYDLSRSRDVIGQGVTDPVSDAAATEAEFNVVMTPTPFPVGSDPRWRPAAILKTSNGHISATRHPIHFVFGSRMGFSGTADWTAPFPVGSNARWRPGTRSPWRRCTDGYSWVNNITTTDCYCLRIHVRARLSSIVQTNNDPIIGDNGKGSVQESVRNHSKNVKSHVFWFWKNVKK